MNLTLLGTLKRVLPDLYGGTRRMLDPHSRRRLIAGARAVRGAVEMYEPCVELDVARLKLMEAEHWIGAADTTPKETR